MRNLRNFIIYIILFIILLLFIIFYYFYYIISITLWHFIYLLSLQLKLWELQINILTHELLTHTRKSFHWCFTCSAELSLNEPWWACCHPFTWILLPTVSFVKSQHPRMASCSAVRVQLPGASVYFLYSLFFVQLFWVDLGRFLFWAMKNACFPLNFFSNS